MTSDDTNHGTDESNPVNRKAVLERIERGPGLRSPHGPTDEEFVRGRVRGEACSLDVGS